MNWIVYFWVIAVLLIAPLPFKIAGYVRGRDDSPRAVKIEEMLNAAVFLVGLVGLYGYAYQVNLPGPSIWRACVVFAALLSVGSLLWSPRLAYVALRLGTVGARVVIGLGFLAFAPMLVGVWRGSGA